MFCTWVHLYFASFIMLSSKILIMKCIYLIFLSSQTYTTSDAAAPLLPSFYLDQKMIPYKYI